MNTQAYAKSNERVDDLGNGYYVIQNPKAFCFGVDAVCLSDFATVKKGERVLDLCTGTGIIPILLCAKTQGEHFTGLEIQQDSVDMARRSVTMNGLSNKISIDCGDIKNGAEIYPPNCFDVVTVNPPYIKTAAGIHNKADSKTIARHEVLCTLSDIVVLSARLLKTGGRLYMVHRPQRLAEIFCTLRRSNMEPKSMQFVQSSMGHEPSLVLLEAIDHGNPMLKVMPTLFLRKDDTNAHYPRHSGSTTDAGNG